MSQAASDVDQLITHYRDATPRLSERDKARLEYQIWNTAKSAGQKTANRVLWVARTLGISTHDVRGRMTLYTNESDAADLLWARVEAATGAMPVHTAADFLTKAKHEALRQGVPVIEALKTLLSDYDAKPFVHVLPSGRVIRRGAPGRTSSLPPPSDQTEQNFWLELRVRISDFIDERLKELDDVDRNAVKNDLEAELRALTDNVRVRVGRMRGHRQRRIGFSEAARACSILLMDELIRGRLPDLTVAQQRYRRLVKQYHPDSGVGANREQYEAVVEAYSLLKEYARQRASAEKGTNNHAGEHRE